MKLHCVAVIVCFALLMTGLGVFAQSPQKATPPAQPTVQPKTTARPPQYVIGRISLTHEGQSVPTWEVQRGNNADPISLPFPSFFKSLTDPGLRQWVGRLPQGSGVSVEFELGGGSRVGHPTPSQAALFKEVNDFTHFCQDKKVQVGTIGALF